LGHHTRKLKGDEHRGGAPGMMMPHGRKY
jgi:hypothetical protein